MSNLKVDHNDDQRADYMDRFSDAPKDPLPTDLWESVKQRFSEFMGFRYAADWRTVFNVALYYVILLVNWNYSSYFHWSIRGLLWFVLTFLSFIGAVIVHNTMHLSLFKREYKMRNYIFQFILSNVYGHPVSSYVPGHNLSHHKYTQLRKDHMRTSKVQYKWNFLNLILFTPTVSLAVTKGDIRYLLVQQKRGNPFFYQAVRESICVTSINLILAYMDLSKFLVYFYIPHIIAQWMIVGMNMLQHDGCDVNAHNVKGGNDTRNFVGPVANFLLFNNGYHSIHHIYPQLHWSLCDEYHDREVEGKIHPNLNQKNILKYIFKTYIYPGKREMYDGTPITFDERSLGPDEDWLAFPRNVKPDDLSLWGAFVDLCNTGLLVGLKIMMPLYSPIIRI